VSVKKILFELTEELLEVIDDARGRCARNPWLEDQLRKTRPVKELAKKMKVKFPDRPVREYPRMR
jgi:hypothetical protein